MLLNNINKYPVSGVATVHNKNDQIQNTCMDYKALILYVCVLHFPLLPEVTIFTQGRVLFLFNFGNILSLKDAGMQAWSPIDGMVLWGDTLHSSQTPDFYQRCCADSWVEVLPACTGSQRRRSLWPPPHCVPENASEKRLSWRKGSSFPDCRRAEGKGAEMRTIPLANFLTTN